LFVMGVLIPAAYVPYIELQGWQSAAAKPMAPQPSYELAAWLNANVPDAARVGMLDAGTTGYFARAHVVNLDGLVNSPDYVDVLLANHIADYAIENRFEYVIVYYAADHPFDIGPATDLTNVCHQVVHTNQAGLLWWTSSSDMMYFQVVALRYGAACVAPWQAGYPFAAVKPD
jgi:hypothetical protein